MERMASAVRPRGDWLAAMWSPLSWVALEPRFVARDAILLPEHSGSTLRGVFGRGLREIACLAGPPACTGCRHPDACIYQAVFESRTPPGAEVLSRNSHVSPPYVIRSPEGRRLSPGEDFAFRMVLVGHAAAHAAYAIEAFRRMGPRGVGRGRGRFELVEVKEPCPDGSNRHLFAGSRGIERARPHGAQEWIARAHPLEGLPVDIEFETPTELREGGRGGGPPEFASLVRALLRRLSTLSHFHCGGPPRLDVRPWIELASGVDVLEVSTRPARWDRWSSRQGRSVPMSGIVGRVRYSPVPAELAPLLWLGEWLHVGKGATSGLGAISVRPGTGEAA